jgi:general secretion pathway protein A
MTGGRPKTDPPDAYPAMSDADLQDRVGESPSAQALAQYGLRENPFSPEVDPRFYCPLGEHEAVLAHCDRTVRQQTGLGFIAGPPGTGKSMLARRLHQCLEERAGGGFLAYLVDGATLGRSSQALLRGLAEHLGAPRRTPNYRLYEAIEREAVRLLENQRTAVLVIDRAECLEPALLETLVLLWNLVTRDASRFLVRIVLFARPSLLDTIREAKHDALRSRIAFGAPRLGPLARGPLARLLEHRVAVAGGPEGLFASGALERLHEASGGIPARALAVAEGALERGSATGESVISARSVEAAGVVSASIGTR